MIHSDEDRRDHGIDVSDRENPNTYYDRDQAQPDPEYVNENLEVMLDLLGSRRRRITIRRLGELDQEADGHATIDHEGLAREVAAIEDDVDPEVVNWRSTRSAKVGLRNNHLPLLEQSDVVDWDDDERTITTTTHTQAYSELIEALEATVGRSRIPDQGERRRSPW